MISKSVSIAEREAIHTIRGIFATEPARTLARKISENTFKSHHYRSLAAQTSGRPMLSVYSVIRRYDAKNRVQQHTA